MKELFLLFQLLIYFTGISFAAGGGNYPGLEPTDLFYLKAVLLAVPVIGMIGHIVNNRRAALCTSAVVFSDNRWLMFYLIFAFISLPLAVDPSYSFERLMYMIAVLAGLFALIVQYKNLKVRVLMYDTIVNHMTVLTTVALIFPFYVLTVYGVHNLIPGYRTALQSYLLIHPNLLASFYAHLLMLHIGCILYLSNAKRLIHWICIAALIFIIALLFSRTVFISLFAVCLIVCPIFYGMLKRRVYLLFPLTMIALSLSLLIAMMTSLVNAPEFLSHLTRGESVWSLATLTNRTELWRILIDEMTLKTAFFGNGYSVVTKDFGVNFGTGILYGAHNAYLSILLGTGLLSLFCMLIYLAVFVFKAVQARFQTPLFISFALLSSFVLFFVNCLAAEEMGVSVSVTFAYVVFMSNMLLKKASP